MVPDGNCGCFTILVLLVLVIVMSVVLVCKKGDTAKDKLEKGLKGNFQLQFKGHYLLRGWTPRCIKLSSLMDSV